MDFLWNWPQIQNLSLQRKEMLPLLSVGDRTPHFRPGFLLFSTVCEIKGDALMRLCVGLLVVPLRNQLWSTVLRTSPSCCLLYGQSIPPRQHQLTQELGVHVSLDAPCPAILNLLALQCDGSGRASGESSPVEITMDIFRVKRQMCSAWLCLGD